MNKPLARVTEKIKLPTSAMKHYITIVSTNINKIIKKYYKQFYIFNGERLNAFPLRSEQARAFYSSYLT